MDTNSKKTKQSIALRLTVVQIVVILVVGISVLLTSSMLMNDYILEDNYQELEILGSGIVSVIKNSDIQNLDLIRVMTDNIGTQRDSTEVIVLDYQFNTVYSTNFELAQNGQQINEALKDLVLNVKRRNSYLGYLSVVIPVTHATGAISGYIIALNSREEFTAMRNYIIVMLLRMIMIAILIGVLFSGYLLRRIIEPLQKLENRIRQVSSGDFAGELEIDSDDEIGDVTRAFNKMSQRLVRYNQGQQRFIQNASHELKSPLMNIQGYAEGLQEGIFDEEEKNKALDVIVSETQRLKNVVEELMYISRIDDTGIKLKYGDVKVVNLVNDAIRTVYTRIHHHHIVLEVNVDEDLKIKGDYNHLVRAIANILDNSVRYASSNITVVASDQPNCVEIVIIDDGKGFDEQDLPKIFERFYKGKRGNTGLGMAIVADIVERHGGVIEAYNEPGAGAAIVMKLPKKPPR